MKSLIETEEKTRKTCATCRKSKSVTQFKKSAKSFDGYTKSCRSCGGTAVKSIARRNRHRGPSRQVCPGCQRTLELSAFAPIEWRPSGRDDICKSCRPILKNEKGLSKYQYEIDLTPEEITSCRLLIETRAMAIYQGVSHRLTWDWMLDHLENWRCEATGKKISPNINASRGLHPAGVSRKNVAHGYTPRNCLIIARPK